MKTQFKSGSGWVTQRLPGGRVRRVECVRKLKHQDQTGRPEQVVIQIAADGKIIGRKVVVPVTPGPVSLGDILREELARRRALQQVPAPQQKAGRVFGLPFGDLTAIEAANCARAGIQPYAR